MKKLFFLTIFFFAASVGFSQGVEKQNVKMGKETLVVMHTNYGKIVLKLYNETPQHRDNFVKLVEKGTYNGLLFHRVIQKFMIQGGDPESRGAKPGKLLGEGDLGYTIPAEFNSALFHKRGALAAARQGDDVNPNKESSSVQFYIVQGSVWDEQALNMMEQRFGKKFSKEQREVYTTLGGAPHLDGDYTVFGEVVEGMEVVDMIASLKCDPNDRPLEDVRIEEIHVIK